MRARRVGEQRAGELTHARCEVLARGVVELTRGTPGVGEHVTDVAAAVAADDLHEAGGPRAALDRMSTNVGALSTLVDDLFELTRLQRGDLRWSIDQIELHDLVHETVEAIRPQATSRDVEVRAELPATLGTARANPEQLQRVLFNLIQNAIRHTPSDGSVTVRAARDEGGTVQIEVADTGSGIAARTAIASSTRSSAPAPTRRAPTAAPASASPSHVRSSRRTAAASGSATRRPAPPCASRCLRHDRRRERWGRRRRERGAALFA